MFQRGRYTTNKTGTFDVVDCTWGHQTWLQKPHLLIVLLKASLFTSGKWGISREHVSLQEVSCCCSCHGDSVTLHLLGYTVDVYTICSTIFYHPALPANCRTCTYHECHEHQKYPKRYSTQKNRERGWISENTK